MVSTRAVLDQCVWKPGAAPLKLSAPLDREGLELLAWALAAEARKQLELWQANQPNRLLDEEEDFREFLNSLPVKKRLVIWDEVRDVGLSPQDIGVGISQLLPVLVAALHHKRGIVAVEQPELHIHPAFQVAIGDLFIEQARENEQMFLVETHSEHLMLRLLRRIRETGESILPPQQFLVPGDLSINFIEPTATGGIRVTRIQVDEDGDFVQRWPRGFFSERAKELFS